MMESSIAFITCPEVVFLLWLCFFPDNIDVVGGSVQTISIISCSRSEYIRATGIRDPLQPSTITSFYTWTTWKLEALM